MKHRLFALVLAAVLLLCALPAAATETTEPTAPVREPGYCGENITWYYENGGLVIQGEGEMDDFPDGAPWANYRNSIVRVSISDGITYIGKGAFRDYDVLQVVTFGKDLYEIGAEAFYSCDSLTTLELPESFKVFGESCLSSCRNLHEIRCAGKFPSFRQNCFWDTYAILYFPAERPWSVELIQQLEEAFHGRIEFLASDGSDPYVPTEPTTEPPTEAPTTVPPATVPPATIPPTTQPTVEPTTEPAVTETTEAQTESMPAPTEAEPEEQETVNGKTGWIGLVIIVLVLGLVLMGRITFCCRKKGKFSR